MFKQGDYVVYGSLGVCRVEDRITRQFEGLKEPHPYYVLQPVYQGGVLYVPADNPKVALRAVITADQANALIDALPSVQNPGFYTRSSQELTAHYEQAMRSHSCADLAGLLHSIYAKKQSLARQNKRIGRVDEQFMHRAEDAFFGELAVALQIPRESVDGYIRQRIDAQQPRS